MDSRSPEIHAVELNERYREGDAPTCGGIHSVILGFPYPTTRQLSEQSVYFLSSFEEEDEQRELSTV
jgi:hypothetical protein